MLQNTTQPVRTMAEALQEPAMAIKETTTQEGNQEETATLTHSPENMTAVKATPKEMNDSQQEDKLQSTDAQDNSSKAAGNDQNAQVEPSQATNGNTDAGEVMEVKATMGTTNMEGGTMTEAAAVAKEGTTVGEGLVPQSTNRMISYYEWRMKHHQWLNAMMRQALGDKEAPEPSHILNLRYPI